MSDAELLFAVLTALYLSECVLWHPGQALAFVRPWGRAWHVDAQRGIAAGAGTLRLLNPLPPLGVGAVCETSPLSLSPQGLVSTGAETLPGGRPHASRELRRLLWAEAGKVACDGRTLLLGGIVFAAFATERAAAAHADLVRRAAAAPPNQREALLREFLRGRLDAGPGRLAQELTTAQGGVLASLCNGLFLWLFVAMPLLCLGLGLSGVLLPGLAIALLFSAIIIPTMWWRRHRKLYPDERRRRWFVLALTVLCPPAAVRVRDSLVRELLAHLHPLAAGALLLEKEAFRGLAAQHWRDLHHPYAGARLAAETGAVVGWWRGAIRAETETFLRAQGFDIAGLLAAPRAEKDCSYYCPRCLNQYAESATVCADCGGLPLEPLVTTT